MNKFDGKWGREIKAQAERKQRALNEATPRPWRWLPDEGQFIVAADDYIVAEVPCQGSNANDGVLIVEAVNAYDDLRVENHRLSAACREMMVERATNAVEVERIAKEITAEIAAEEDELQVLRARVTELEAENEDFDACCRGQAKTIVAQNIELAKLEAERNRLREALRPFAYCRFCAALAPTTAKES